MPYLRQTNDACGNRARRFGAVRHLGHSAAAEYLTHVLAEIAEGDAAIDRRLALPGVKVGASNDSPVQ